MFAFAYADECALFCEVRQIAGCGGGRSSGKRAVVARAQTAFESFRALSEHAKERLLLPFIDLAAQPVQELYLGDNEFYLPNAATLRFQRDFSEPSQPLHNVNPPVGSLKRLIIALLVCQDRCRQRHEHRLVEALRYCFFSDGAPDSTVPVFEWMDRLEKQMGCSCARDRRQRFLAARCGAIEP